MLSPTSLAGEHPGETFLAPGSNGVKPGGLAPAGPGTLEATTRVEEAR
jgi:hypothetical protein